MARNNITVPKAEQLHTTPKRGETTRKGLSLAESVGAGGVILGFAAAGLAGFLEIVDQTTGVDVLPNALSGAGIVGGVALGATSWYALGVIDKKRS